AFVYLDIVKLQFHYNFRNKPQRGTVFLCREIFNPLVYSLYIVLSNSAADLSDGNELLLVSFVLSHPNTQRKVGVVATALAAAGMSIHDDRIQRAARLLHLQARLAALPLFVGAVFSSERQALIAMGQGAVKKLIDAVPVGYFKLVGDRKPIFLR